MWLINSNEQLEDQQKGPRIEALKMTTEAYTQSPQTDTFKQVAVARPATIEHNGDCTLQVNDRDCTLEPSDHDCTLEVNRRAEDSNKEMVNQTPQAENQTEVDESGQGQLAVKKPRKIKQRPFTIACAVIGAIVVLIIIIVPSIIATRH